MKLKVVWITVYGHLLPDAFRTRRKRKRGATDIREAIEFYGLVRQLAPQSRAKCKRLIFDNLLSQIVDDNRAVKIDDGRLAAIFFSDEIFPFLGIKTLGIFF